MQKLFTKAVENAMKKVPIGSQDGLGMDAKVLVRLFGGRCTWYILEGDGDFLYGLANLGYGFEYGSMSRPEFEQVQLMYPWAIERDIMVDPLKMTLGQCMKRYNEEMGMY